jgi:hypothetical protein
MTREELVTSLAEKHIPQFASSVLGYVLGTLLDYGVTKEEALSMCNFLLIDIDRVRQNPETLKTVKKLASQMDAMVGGQ